MKTKHLAALLQPNLTTVKVWFPSNGAAPFEQETQVNTNEEPFIDIYGDVQLGTVKLRRPTQLSWDNKQPPQFQQKNQGAPKLYTYKVLKDEGYKVGDTAVALTERGLVLVVVAEVHESAQLDLDADFDYKWLVQRVDTSKLVKQQQAEKNFQAAILEIERRKQRERVKKELMDFYGDTPEGLALLEASIAQLEGAKNDN